MSLFYFSSSYFDLCVYVSKFCAQIVLLCKDHLSFWCKKYFDLIMLDVFWNVHHDKETHAR
jgi:hypothetical protein